MDFNIETGEELLTLFLLLIFAAIAIVLLVVIFRILSFTREVNDSRLGIVREPFSWKKYFAKSTFSRSIAHEEEIMLDHNYDGIRELDNHLPPWWLGLFYGGIAFAIVYLLAYHVWDWAPLQNEEYLSEMIEAEEDVQAYKATLAMSIDESNVVLISDEPQLAAAKEIYTAKCVACHGMMGEGGVGPNLTDAYWLHGGSVSEIFSVLKYGVPEKGMIAWESQIKPDEMQDLTSYILTLQGTNPPNAKEPQGDLVEPEVEEAKKDEQGEVAKL
jgi:cytochrome c oxidase cbb3-type subunit 3